MKRRNFLAALVAVIASPKILANIKPEETIKNNVDSYYYPQYQYTAPRNIILPRSHFKSTIYSRGEDARIW